MKKLALLSVKTTSAKGVEVFRPVLDELRAVATVQRISSVYRVDRFADNFMMVTESHGDWGAEGYIVVMQVKINSDLAAFVRLAASLESFAVSVNILAVEGETVTTPVLTLPHPEFHNRPEELIPACEIWPDMEHPLLHKSLRELALVLPKTPWGEFHCQGQVLLDKQAAGTEKESP